MENFKAFLKKKDIEISAKRYGIDALGAMAQGLFASLLIGTIIATIGEQAGLKFLVEIGTYAKAATGPAMAIAIGYALHCPPLVLFSLAAVGAATNTLGGAGGPLAVLIVTIFASELGKLVSKETKIDIIVTPFVTITAGILHHVGNRTPAILHGYYRFRYCRYCTYPSYQQCCNMCRTRTHRTGRRSCTCRMLCPDGRFRSTFIP